jgi:hypothetical protein
VIRVDAGVPVHVAVHVKVHDNVIVHLALDPQSQRLRNGPVCPGPGKQGRYASVCEPVVRSHDLGR